MDEKEWESIHMVAREEATKLLIEHLGLCPFSKQQIELRLRLQEQRFYALVGFMIGGGFFGGVAGGALVKILGG
jgi:hypothetical protein